VHLHTACRPFKKTLRAVGVSGCQTSHPDGWADNLSGLLSTIGRASSQLGVSAT
jgi:hypothetical protein